jgi:AP-3 complex subunit delta
VKYVALLAFNRIVVTHPFLVAQQEDVILECIDSEDITIRIKALDLVQGMVSSDNLLSIVSRLMRQLKASSSALELQSGQRKSDPETDSSDETSAGAVRKKKSQDQPPPLPEDYTVDVIGRILHMCSHDNYASLLDFDWYLDVLTQLVRIAPMPRARDMDTRSSTQAKYLVPDISEKVGNEIRNVAVKVEAVRPAALQAAELIITRLFRVTSESAVSHPAISGGLKPTAYIAGEYALQLSSPDDTLGHLLHLLPRIENPEILATCLQAVIKLFALVAGNDRAPWTAERKSSMSLLMARVVHVLEPLALHPYLEVQERAVEFIELLKLTAEAASGQVPSTDEVHQDPPLLLTQAIPSMFNGWQLKSVSYGAQKNVPIPEGLDLDEPIHPNLGNLLAQADSLMLPIQEDDEFEAYYNNKPPAMSFSGEPAILRLADAPEEVSGSYQQAGEESYLDPDIVARRKAERMERKRDDPFYILGSGGSGGTSTPIHNILQKENGPDLDIDAIPIMKLDLADVGANGGSSSSSKQQPVSRPKPRQKVVVAADESLGGSGLSTPRYESENNSDNLAKSRAKKLKQSLLQVDSSHLNTLNLDASSSHLDSAYDPEKQQQDEAEMAQAMKEVQRLRLEMQRAKERIHVAQGVPAEGIVVKRKKSKKPAKVEGDELGEAAGGEPVAKEKKKKKKAIVPEGEGALAEGEGVVNLKKKKVKKGAEVVDS